MVDCNINDGGGSSEATYAMESEDSQPQTTDTATVQTTKAAEPTLARLTGSSRAGTTNSAIADSTGKYNLTLEGRAPR